MNNVIKLSFPPFFNHKFRTIKMMLQIKEESLVIQCKFADGMFITTSFQGCHHLAIGTCLARRWWFTSGPRTLRGGVCPTHLLAPVTHHGRVSIIRGPDPQLSIRHVGCV